MKLITCREWRTGCAKWVRACNTIAHQRAKLAERILLRKAKLTAIAMAFRKLETMKRRLSRELKDLKGKEVEAGHRYNKAYKELQKRDSELYRKEVINDNNKIIERLNL
jgi:hypothetical protein